MSSDTEDHFIRNVLLVGATGRLGSRVIRSLLESPFEIHTLTRSSDSSSGPVTHSTVTNQDLSDFTLPLPPASLLPSGRIHKTDYSAASLKSIFTENHVDAIVSCMSPSPDGIASQGVMIDAAVQSGVKVFIPSEWGLDTWSVQVRETTMGLFDNKWELIKRLEETARGAQGSMHWMAIVNGAFFDMAILDGELDTDISKREMTIWEDGDLPICCSSMPFIGGALVNLLKRYADRPDKWGNKQYYIAETRITQNQLLDYLEAKTKTHPEGNGQWKISHTTIDRQLDLAKACFAQGDIMGAIKPLCYAAGYRDSGGDFTAHGRGLSNEELGLAEPDLDRAWSNVERWMDDYQRYNGRGEA